MQRSAGIVRKVDRLGRILTPIELRRALDISIGDLMEISLEDDIIILRKHKTEQTCAITGEFLDEYVKIECIKGLLLSPNGATILFEELQKHAKKRKE